LGRLFQEVLRRKGHDLMAVPAGQSAR
jgi:hypothetical protein